MRGDIVTEVATRGTPADYGTVRAFQIDVPQEALGDVRHRIAATRWPDRETVNVGHLDGSGAQQSLAGSR
jgi:hypothetical protein